MGVGTFWLFIFAFDDAFCILEKEKEGVFVIFVALVFAAEVTRTEAAAAVREMQHAASRAVVASISRHAGLSVFAVRAVHFSFCPKNQKPQNFPFQLGTLIGTPIIWGMQREKQR